MKSLSSKVVLVPVAVCMFSMAIGAASAWDRGTSPMGKAEQNKTGMVSADRLLELSTPTPDSLRMEGEQSLRFGNLAKAITYLQKSVELAPADIDGRILFAQALEKKLELKKERDPAVYNLLVKQWLFVLKKSQVTDQTSVGRSHLRSLTGTSPHKFETMAGFIARVSMPEEQSSPDKIADRGGKLAGKANSGILR